MLDRPRVLLLWPGALFGGRHNFGVPQLLSIAAFVRARTGAHVDVIDLDAERALGPFDLARVLGARYDVVGLSCYSSYDFLKVTAIAERVRVLAPSARIVVGGYHASARPSDFEGPGAPFDHVVIGEGERPMAEIVGAFARGERLGPSPLDPNELPAYDWSLLERYRPVARRVASQVEIYLSRGCPFTCAFCMERAKRETSWRALDAVRAVEELHALDRSLDLSRFTVFVADALFGMRASWRRAFLGELARRPLRARKLWLLSRLDLLDEHDFDLMAAANVALGFGLESGDPVQLALVQKTRAAEEFLDRAVHVVEWAKRHDVPIGLNLVVGHPGETERSLRATAAYLERLLSRPGGTTAFVSLDP